MADESELPDDVKNLKPADKNYAYGSEIDLDSLLNIKEVKGKKDGKDGKWKFVSWNKAGKINLNSNDYP